MPNRLGGPREGNCSVQMWTVGVDEPAQILGEMPWAVLIDGVADLGGTRPTYDLFDLPQPDGTVLRYRAVDVHEG